MAAHIVHAAAVVQIDLRLGSIHDEGDRTIEHGLGNHGVEDHVAVGVELIDLSLGDHRRFSLREGEQLSDTWDGTQGAGEGSLQTDHRGWHAELLFGV